MASKENNPLDQKHKLPEKYSSSKKNVCGHIRKAAQGKIEKDKEISVEMFKEFTDLKEIEKLLFDSVLSGDYEFFVVRLYVV